MSSFPLHVLLLWASSALAQLIVLVLLVPKGKFRKLPFFTAYVALNLCQVAFLALLYSSLGTNSLTTKALAWYSEVVTLLAQATATIEILAITLKPYRGIWALAWRALAYTSALVAVLVAVATRGHWATAFWFELERGYQLTFASAVAACLLLIRYYSIPVPTAYKMILGGFCFYSCTDILIDDILQGVLKTSFVVYQPIWQSMSMLSFIVALAVWVVALAKPLPVQDRGTAATSDSLYQRLSPEINEQLRRINEKLLRLWKLEARPQ